MLMADTGVNGHARSAIGQTKERLSLTSHTLRVAEQAAENPDTSSGTLRELAEHDALDVRCGVALNGSTPVETLRVLAGDEHWWVRRGVARNENTPVETLWVLAVDEYRDVRYKGRSEPGRSPRFAAGTSRTGRRRAGFALLAR